MASLIRLLLRRPRSLDLFRLRPPDDHQRGRRQPAPHHQGLFPRLILPISAALSGLVDFAIGFVVLAIFTVVYGMRPTLAALWLPALLPSRRLHRSWRRLWLSALNALYRDVKIRD